MARGADVAEVFARLADPRSRMHLSAPAGLFLSRHPSLLDLRYGEPPTVVVVATVHSGGVRGSVLGGPTVGKSFPTVFGLVRALGEHYRAMKPPAPPAPPRAALPSHAQWNRIR